MQKGLKTLKNQKILRLGQVFILLTLFSGWIFARQTVTVPTPKPKPKASPTARPDESPVITVPPEKPLKKTPVGPSGKVGPINPAPTVSAERRVTNEQDIPFEKSIEVDGKVNIGLCVSEGNIKINGWERDEIRVFVNRGSKAGFRVLNKNSDGKPTRMTILGYDPVKDKGRDVNQCLSGEEIELDVPIGTNLSRLAAREARVTITIDTIARARGIAVNEGDIELRGIEEGIEAKSFDGDISVEGSNGAIDLDTTNGSILVFNVEPVEEGDILKVRANSGNIVLQSTGHSVLNAVSITGAIKFTGEIQSDGQYKFSNTNGQISLWTPTELSCTVQVISHKDKFFSDFPVKISTENVYPPSMKKFIGTIGSTEGETGIASINLETQNGRITIRKIK
jgi:hypothetical protein